ncbi:YciI family protein [Paralcaligenes ureilyticus]|uniref:YCII-related domain-containing protein n=1 Tax=Paralcaligenes ureilyticus TaxID=627131 RepID=A0A4R3M655_9BURK|nr:YciI family protein [Paralcaligenes ureilyticus]TCT08881.1 hypothetical protein EDC26_10439 [Paralcaligenes ureilyticus]
MYFLIIANDKPGLEHKRDELRARRIAWLKDNEHIILAAGGKVDDRNQHVQGGLLIVNVADRAEAELFANADPFVPAGLYETMEVTRWRRVFFDYRQITDPNPFAPD